MTDDGTRKINGSGVAETREPAAAATARQAHKRNWIAWLRIKWLDMRYRPGPGEPCGKCPTCRSGLRHRCPRARTATEAETSPEETA